NDAVASTRPSTIAGGMTRIVAPTPTSADSLSAAHSASLSTDAHPLSRRPLRARRRWRHLDRDVRRLDGGNRHHPGREAERVDRLAGQERHHPMRPYLDLDLGRDLVLDDARDDARQPVADGLLAGYVPQARSILSGEQGGER